MNMSQGFGLKSNWPDGCGVYLIWRKCNEVRELLYIGKTGTLKPRVEGLPQIRDFEQGFRKRLERWTPYSFFQEHFCYCPKFGGNKKPSPHLEANYSERVPLSEIEIDFFICPDLKLAPAYLEALLLQSYIATNMRLPPANNSF
jgi:hypothetical protein